MSDVLVVPASTSATIRALGEEAARRGLRVVPVRRGDDLRAALSPMDRTHFFGGPLLAEHVRRAVPLALLEPADGWLPELPARFLRRSVRLMAALDAYGLQDRWFIKMPREKELESGAYRGFELPTLPDGEPLLVSELVTMTSEWRCWILDGEVRAASTYRRRGQPHAEALDAQDPVLAFVSDLLDDQRDRLPSAVVVDVAWIEAPEPGLAVVEANMAWFSSHYAADPAGVLDVVLRSAGPPELVAEGDTKFCT